MKKKKEKVQKEKYMYAVCISGDEDSFTFHETYADAVEQSKKAVGEGCNYLVIYKAFEKVDVSIEFNRLA